jgi:hypothetical protein
MPGIYVRADIKGIDEMLGKLMRGKPIYAEPWKRALRTSVTELEQKERQMAPRNTGHLEARMTSRLDAKAVPEWGVVSNDVTSSRGTRYGFILNAKDMHYQHGSRRGRLTRGWFTNTFHRFRKRVDELLGKAAKEIEAAWSR